MTYASFTPDLPSRHETCLTARCLAYPGAPNVCVGEPVKGRLPGWLSPWSRRRRLSPAPDGAGDARRSDGPPKGSRLDLAARLALLAALLVATLTVLAGVFLVQQTAAHRHALLMMGQVEERIAQEHVVKRQAILDPRRASDLATRLKESRQLVIRDLEELERDEWRIGLFDRVLRLAAAPKDSGCVRVVAEGLAEAVGEGLE